MAAVTQSVTNYLGGVSKQNDRKKLPGQVREALNALPDPTFGLRKRPGTKYISDLKWNSTTWTTTKPKWFYIDNDETDKYIGCIDKHNIVIDGVATDVGFPRIWHTNGTECAITHVSVGGILPTAYLDPTNNASDYDVLTVQATTFITNKKKTVEARAATAYTAKSKGTVFIKQVKYSTSYGVKITIDGTDYEPSAHVTINAQSEVTGDTELTNTADSIVSALKTNIDAVTFPGTMTATKLPTSLELSYVHSDGTAKGFDIVAIDNQGSSTMVAFNDEVSNQTKIPDQSIADRVVKINNTAQVKDAYYVKFTPDNGTSGAGYWTEGLGPNMSPGLKGETMPHTLLRTGQYTFNFQQALTSAGVSSWGDRLVGDDETNKHPSFVSGNIAQTFFHNNRLGVLTADNVVMSRASEFYEFYNQSALTASDSDPIDVNTSSIKPAKLHSVLPTAQGLVLFSSQQQFIMFADSKILTPGSTVIRGVSNYEIDTTIPPVEVGTAVTFVSKTPSFTRVHSINTRGNEESPLIQDIGKVVSEWIPETVDSLITSPQNQMIALYGRTDQHVYFYKTHFVGDKNIMQAWFRWKMPANVEFVTITKDVMWTVINDGTNKVLLKSNISKSADDDVLQTQDGQYVNPHMDMFSYPTAAGKVELVDDSGTPDTEGENTRIELPFTHIAGLTPVILIKGTGVTESGFTTTPTVSGSGPYYFTVSNKDLKTNTTYTDIALGYQFEYDIELPKTYFKLNPDGTQYDYAASLTISRMRFAVGLSSGLGFKLKRRGYIGPSKEYIGDSSTDAFNVDFPLKQENGIVVKLDGAKQASSTYSVTTTDTSATVTFNSAPNGEVDNGDNSTTPAQKILITTDTWYDVQTVLEADQYLADDVPMTEEAVFTLPIHQRSDNFDLRIYSNSPFPVALSSMVWEGQYSPRYYKRV